MKAYKTIILAASILSLTACNLPFTDFLQQVTLTATPVPTATATPLPTATPIPTATPTPPPSVRLEKASDLYAQGNWDDAEKELQDVLAFSNDQQVNASALSLLGRIFHHRADDVSALDYLRRAIALDANPDASAEAHFYLAQIYEELTRYTEAAGEYQAYMDAKPGILDALMFTKKGDALTAAGSLADANTAYTRAISLSGGQALDLDLKVAGNLVGLQDYANALDRYNYIYNASTSDYTRAQVDLLVGRIYLSQGDTANAYQRFQDAVENYPRAYDSYSALAALVNDDQPVNLLNRGIINYNVGQYYLAIDILKQYMDENPDHDGTAHYYRAYAYTYAGEYENAIHEWEMLITDHPSDRYYATAWDEKAYTQWYYLNKHAEAAQTLKEFIANNPLDGMAPMLLFEMGRIYERANMLEDAASAWERLPGEYPSSEYAYMGIFFSGIARYRLQQWDQAQTAFQRALLLATKPGEKAGAYFWMGKTSQAQGNEENAHAAWQAAMVEDPTGYYSERARDLLTNRQMMQKCETLDLAVDLNADRPEAEAWMKDKFSLAEDTDFREMSAILVDGRIRQAAELWRLGLYEDARVKVEAYREEYKNDPLIQYKLANWLNDLGMYRSAILASRQVLTLAGMDDTATLNAPVFFNHIRFGVYYREIITQTAQQMGLDPLLLFSVIRQESLFEPFITSSAGAEGLMQMLPGTAQDVSTQSGYYPDLKAEDIYRPLVAIRLGSYYLKQQFSLQNDFTPAALAAYNGGPGNATAWRDLSGDDVDLYLEVVRFQETRNYIRAIVEIYNIYRSFYCR